MALVKGLVEMHGGSVEVRSPGIGKGSEFVVRLPQAPSDERESMTKIAAATGSRRWRVLVVDDNRDAAASLAMLLTLMGHDTRTAHDGLEGLELAEAFRPELVLLDIGLPKLNGYETCRRIREKPPDLTISVSFASPACAPSAAPTSCSSDVGTQIMVEAL